MKKIYITFIFQCTAYQNLDITLRVRVTLTSLKLDIAISYLRMKNDAKFINAHLPKIP